MNFEDRIIAFFNLGKIFAGFSMSDESANAVKIRRAMEKSYSANPWFTIDNQVKAIRAIGNMINRVNLLDWTTPYLRDINGIREPKTVAVVMAGNIPLVGFHDFLAVLISGHRIAVKLSADDPWLLPAVAEIISEMNPDWNNLISFSGQKLPPFDAIIATGSNNSSHYFDFYFNKYPRIIRHHRNSVAVITGKETQEEVTGLASDIMSYFGLGCRNVSKIYIPPGYDFSELSVALSAYRGYLDHHKYRNNYDYNKSMFLMNQVQVLDTGSVLITENREISSRIAVLHYETYNNHHDLNKELSAFSNDIQCVVSASAMPGNTVRPGNTQNPSLTDYPDQVNILDFLLKI